MPQKFGTAQSYQSASENCILKKFPHGPMSYRPGQLRKHQPAIFGCCTNSRKTFHGLDTFGISLLQVLSLRHVIQSLILGSETFSLSCTCSFVQEHVQGKEANLIVTHTGRSFAVPLIWEVLLLVLELLLRSSHRLYYFSVSFGPININCCQFV